MWTEAAITAVPNIAISSVRTRVAEAAMSPWTANPAQVVQKAR
ncbi:hypothetical protein [Streptomyces sp. SM13]|nr:hypothetical protein [Streptomyces sp. SM13]